MGCLGPVSHANKYIYCLVQSIQQHNIMNEPASFGRSNSTAGNEPKLSSTGSEVFQERP
jgi:hypothetical protein